MKLFEFLASVFMLCVSAVCIPIALAFSAFISYLKKLNWIALLGIAIFSIILAIVNNIRVDEGKSVQWIGTQEVMKKPEELQSAPASTKSLPTDLGTVPMNFEENPAAPEEKPADVQ